MPPPLGCRKSTASSACSTRVSRRKGSSAAPSAWRSPGSMPVPEIQFRKYAEPAAEQLNDCGSMRWRTANRFAAPMVVRMPGGFFKCRRSLAQPVQRGPVRARGRLAPGDAVECRRRRGTAAIRAARQRSDHLLRAPRDARRRLGAPSLPGGRFRGALRPGAGRTIRHRPDDRYLGCDGRALRGGQRPGRRSMPRSSTCARSCRGTALPCSTRSSGHVAA